LAKLDPELAQRLELRLGFNAFGDELASGLAREGDENRAECAADWVALDRMNPLDIELQVGGLQRQDVTKARVA
jgi:hypothetical protein